MHKMTIPICSELPANFREETFRVQKIDLSSPVPRHKHSCYELFFITGGEGTFHIDCQDYHINRQSIFLVSPRRIHGWEDINHLQGYLLKFDLSMFAENSFLNHMTVFNFDLVHIEGSELAMIQNTFDALAEEYVTSKSFKNCTISSLLQILLIYIQRTLPVENVTYSTNALFSKLTELMQKNGHKIAQPSCYARKLKTNIKLLNHAVKEVTGDNVGDYIRNNTILEAQRLLKYDTMTCNEIAYHLGFTDPAYFSRFFKREVGVSPKNFRESLS